MFQKHLALLMVHFCFQKFIGPLTISVKIHDLLDEGKLELLTSFFKIIVQSNHVALGPSLVCNLVI